VGLGPSTVVRLERALAHEILRYCTAIRGSVLKVVRVQVRGTTTGRVNWFTMSIGHDRKPMSTHGAKTACIHGHAKTALNTGLVQTYGSQRCPVKLVLFAPALHHRMREKHSMVVRRDYLCQATRRPTPGFVSMNTTILTLVRLPVGAERPEASSTPVSTAYAQSVDNRVEKRTYDARASTHRRRLDH
jgi:hypothetical protein